MAHYPGLRRLIPPSAESEGDWKAVVSYLVDVWLSDYRASGRPNIVETRTGGFSYLFDIASERLIAAWGISQGRHGGKRDAGRMKGHPLSAGPLYHRGHAIPHTMGGPTDINLVPQHGKINVGAFRPLEKKAVATPGSFYFTYWSYPRLRAANDEPGQTPSGVDQGLLIPGHDPQINSHGN